MKKILGVLLFVFLLAAPAWAADNYGGTGAGNSVSAAGVINATTVWVVCGTVYVQTTVTVTGNTDDTGYNTDVVNLVIWNVGNVKANDLIEVPVGATRTFTILQKFPGPLGQLAPGVGVVLHEVPGGGNIDWVGELETDYGCF